MMSIYINGVSRLVRHVETQVLYMTVYMGRHRILL